MPAPRNVTDPPATQRPKHPTAILAIICISYFMVILDNSIIFTGLPRIEAAMEFSPTGLTWVQDAYTLVFGGLLLLGRCPCGRHRRTAADVHPGAGPVRCGIVPGRRGRLRLPQ